VEEAELPLPVGKLRSAGLFLVEGCFEFGDFGAERLQA
jgi:hypothetical protein